MHRAYGVYDNCGAHILLSPHIIPTEPVSSDIPPYNALNGEP